MERTDKNMDQLSPALGNDAIQENWSFDDFYQINKETEDVKMKLLEYQNECESIDMEIYNVNQLKDKGTYILKHVGQKFNDINEELKEIHCNYVKCTEIASANDETVHQKIDSLTVQRDNLKKELEQLKKTEEDNNKKLMEVKKMITIQEKQNMALIRKLKKTAEKKHLTADLRSRVNMISNDPRNPNIRPSNLTTEQ